MYSDRNILYFITDWHNNKFANFTYPGICFHYILIPPLPFQGKKGWSFVIHLATHIPAFFLFYRLHKLTNRMSTHSTLSILDICLYCMPETSFFDSNILLQLKIELLLTKSIDETYLDMLPEFAPKHLYKTVFLKFLKTQHTLFLSFAFHFHTFLNNLSRKTILWTLDIYLHCIFLFLLKALCKGCLLILQTDPTRILDFWIFPRHYMSSYNQSIQTMAQALKWNVYVGVNFYVAIR